MCCHGRIKRSAVDHVHPRSPAQICLIVSRPARVAIKKPQALDVRRASAPLLPASSCTHPSAFSGSPWFSYPPGTPRLWRRLSSSASPGQYPAPAYASSELRPPTDPCLVSRVALPQWACSVQSPTWELEVSAMSRSRTPPTVSSTAASPSPVSSAVVSATVRPSLSSVSPPCPDHRLTADARLQCSVPASRYSSVPSATPSTSAPSGGTCYRPSMHSLSLPYCLHPSAIRLRCVERVARAISGMVRLFPA